MNRSKIAALASVLATVTVGGIATVVWQSNPDGRLYAAGGG